MAVNKNKDEKRDARRLQQHLDISYVHALRLLREGKYMVLGGVVKAVTRS